MKQATTEPTDTTVQTLQSLIQRRIRQDVQSMHAYAIQDSVGMVKLDAMENPHRLPAALQAELGQRLGELAFNRYPDGRVNDLRRALAAHANMPQGFELMLGNGSDELISLLALACDVPAVPGAAKPAVLAPLPGFVMYAMSAQLQGLDFIGVPLTANFALDVPAMVQAIETRQPAIVYLAYPNNPTANLWDAGDMAQVIAAAKAAGCIVAIDEAYQPFSSRTYLDVIRVNPTEHSHVLLMRTMSKFGLAGVRLGYMMGAKELIAQVDKVRPPYNISVLNYECALFALAHQDVFAAQAQDIREQRSRLIATLRATPGLTVFDSDANMILVRIEGGQNNTPDSMPEADRAQKVFDGMKARGVLVKNVSKMHPLLAHCLRLTVGTFDENSKMIVALQESL
jgi:histidinol-phosphate aminotransferase